MNHSAITEAVVFFEDGLVSKEMMYPEFEAILDGVVEIEDFEGCQIQAAYVEIDAQLLVHSAVLFVIDFDKQGVAARNWNLPLQHLAFSASAGPDLGAGPIRLACKSHCPVSWHQAELWDPNLSPEHNSLLALKRAAKRNHLGLLEEKLAPVLGEINGPQSMPQAAVNTQALSARLSKEFEQRHRLKVANLIKKQRLHIATLKSTYENELAQLRQQQSQSLEQYQQLQDSQQKDSISRIELNNELKLKIQSLRDEFEGDREKLMDQLGQQEGDQEDRVQLMREQYEQQTQARIDAGLAELNEQLQSMELEAAYHLEKEERLNAQVLELKAQTERLKSIPEGDSLAQLSASGVVFVCYHPGVGHITIPLQDISSYMENIEAYIAAKCFVDELTYKSWLAHYESMSCESELADGGRCGARIDRCDKPSDFVEGFTNCCDKHKRHPALRPVLRNVASGE